MTLHADVFADALDGMAFDLLEDTERMMGVVGRLHGLPGTAALSNAGARPAFRSELRARLLEQAGAPVLVDSQHAKVVPITSRWNQSWARRNRTRLLTSAAAGVIIVTAVSVGASGALPGNPLYPVKRGGESVEYALTGSDEARGKLELSFARTRLDEIAQLTSHDAAFGIAPVTGIQAAGGSTVLATSTNTWVVRLFGDMDGNAVKGSALLQKSFQNNPRPAPLREVQEFALLQEAQLKVLKGRLAGPALSKATSSLIWATAVVKQTTAGLLKCSGNTCPANVAAALSTPGAPTPSAAPTNPAAPSVTPSLPFALVPSTGVPSVLSVVPPASTPATAPPASTPPNGGPPQSTPTAPVAVPPTTPAPPTSASPSPSDTPTTPTTTDVTVTPPPSTATTPSPVPTPTTGAPTPDPTTQVPIPPTSPDVPTTDPVTTTPAPPTTDPVATTPAPVTTTDPPVVTTPAPVITTDPPVVTTPAPVITTDPPVVTTPAPVITTDPPVVTTPPTSAPPTSQPGLICLPGGHLINGICIRLPGPPGRI